MAGHRPGGSSEAGCAGAEGWAGAAGAVVGEKEGRRGETPAHAASHQNVGRQQVGLRRGGGLFK